MSPHTEQHSLCGCATLNFVRSCTLGGLGFRTFLVNLAWTQTASLEVEASKYGNFMLQGRWAIGRQATDSVYNRWRWSVSQVLSLE